jgi:RNA polymerase-associated protein RTF1
LAFGTGASPKKSTGPTEQERLAELNRLNRKANREDIRKAQLAEKRAEQKNLAAVMRGEATPNPFARVKTRAKVMHNVDGDYLAPGTPGSSQAISREATPGLTGSPMPGTPSSSQKRSVPGEKKSGLPTLAKKMGDDDIIANMGIEVDIEM